MSPHEQLILSTIQACGSRVTAADVATKTGFALNIVTRELNRLAEKCKAILEVSSQGTIVYVFPTDPQRFLQADSIVRRLHQIWQVAANFIYFLVRCSFGLLLVASILTLLLIGAIILVMILFASDTGGHQDAGCDVLNFDFFDFENFFLFFCWWQHNSDSQNFDYLGQKVDLGDPGFLFNCFSFLFGNGNPNRDFSDRSWQYLGALIRANNGVIVAEQAAPYLPAHVVSEDRSMFPVLVHFDGAPVVTSNGSIAYVFPNLQVSANGGIYTGTLPAFAEERIWKFTDGPIRRLEFVFLFAAANLAGWYAIWHNALFMRLLYPYDTMVFVFLSYAVFFLAFPMLRQFLNNIRNGFVDHRNSIRKRDADRLSSPEMKAKMAEAQAYALRLHYIPAGHAVYTTEKDLLEQQF